MWSIIYIIGLVLISLAWAWAVFGRRKSPGGDRLPPRGPDPPPRETIRPAPTPAASSAVLRSAQEPRRDDSRRGGSVHTRSSAAPSLGDGLASGERATPARTETVRGATR